MLVVMWRFMWVALSKHLLNVSQGGWRQGGGGQCWDGSPVAVAASVAIAHSSWVAIAICAIGARQDVKAGLWSARGSQIHHRSLNEKCEKARLIICNS